MKNRARSILTPVLTMGGMLLASILQAQERASCQVIVTTDPPGAMVSCDGVARNASPVTIGGLKPGEHLIAATQQGFNEARRTVTLTVDQSLPVELKLEQICGLVVVHSDPAQAEVQVDGADRGKTPILLTDLPLGRHRVRVNLTGFTAKEVDLNIKDRTPQKIDVNLSSDSAKLTIESEPTGANVMLNGIAKGTTPCSLDRIPAGSNTIELELEGYIPVKQVIKLAAGREEKITVPLKTIPAELTIVSIPSKARIYVNNQFRGESPVTLKDIEPGSVRVRAELKGHEASARTIALVKGQKTIEEFRLERNSGTLEITTEPADAKVYIDGVESGTTTAKPDETDRISDQLVLDFVSLGEHKIQITKKGFFSKSFTVTVEKDKTITRHEKMDERFVPNCEVLLYSGVKYQGLLKDVDVIGNIKLEIKPGVIKAIQKKDIRTRRALREDVEEEIVKPPDKKEVKKDVKKSDTVKETAE